MNARPLSIVVPAWREAAGIAAALQALAPLRERGAEVIVVDGGSDDGTAALAAPWADRVLVAVRGRARQMNAGAAVAGGDVLLFLHADTRLPAGADRLIAAALGAAARQGHGAARGPSPRWGRFDVCIDGRARVLRLVATLMNWRSRLTGIATGDQAIFVERRLFEQIGGYADQPLMEDIELSRRLRAHGAPACLRARVVTSGRRWEQRGPWRTIFLMWRLRWRYWRGESPQALAEAYR
jgi:rSAM/selenodomain-associated transferase 2